MAIFTNRFSIAGASALSENTTLTGVAFTRKQYGFFTVLINSETRSGTAEAVISKAEISISSLFYIFRFFPFGNIFKPNDKWRRAKARRHDWNVFIFISRRNALQALNKAYDTQANAAPVSYRFRLKEL